MQLRTTPTTKKGKHRLRKVITIRQKKITLPKGV
jgi:hypothetical protein